eukprot:CAMPEP_0194029886 /NCGR_PEP_ID=MMETSP0009_2-20130614/3520_1 /TAXON_ID=210454 /ORGANISM="Grammatophora oceanica, Strain CCMP 410" /LENGTH=568 /DNA_ID=CAMNT_0038669697 /DNA_START=87 /DNA_END=1793 /DNA_ORIENTATION=-
MYDTIQVNRRGVDYRKIAIICVCIAAFATIVGLSVGLANAKRQGNTNSGRSAPTIPSGGPDGTNTLSTLLDQQEDPRCHGLDAENGVNQNPIFHCACFGEMGTMNDDMIRSAADIATVLPDSDIFPELKLDETSMKCDKDPRFQVFWWLAWYQLATDAFPVEDKPLAEDIVVEYMFLGELFLETGGLDRWIISDNWMSSKSICMWFGINCRNGEQHADAIVLRHNGLIGIIPESISAAPSLREIVLHDNEVGDEIPETLWRMDTLEILDLGNNLLTGSISDQISRLKDSLIKLDIKSNYLTGELPSELGECTSLHELKLEDNDFEGTIPSTFGQLTGLQKLSLATNYDITGPLPDAFGLMTQLRELSLHDMDLSGTIPAAMVNTLTMSNLEHIRIDNNYFNGTIPATIAAAWPHMTFLDVRKNEFTGSLPTEMGRMSLLELASFSENLFTGTIPTEFGQLKELKHLHISFTDVTGYMPAEICTLRQDGIPDNPAEPGLQILVADCGYMSCACCNVELTGDECDREEDDDYSSVDEEEEEEEEEEESGGDQEELQPAVEAKSAYLYGGN